MKSRHTIIYEREDHIKLMKTKKLFSLALVCALLVSVVFGGTDVSAKSKVPFKVTYKGKTVTLVEDYNTLGQNTKRVSLQKVKKAWGKCKTKKESACTTYTWKTKKTEIAISDNWHPGKVSGMSISIKDKNGSIAGVKVGMTKAQALKKLKKTFGSSHVKLDKYTDSNKSFIRIDNIGMNFFDIKSGKIVSMSYFSS